MKDFFQEFANATQKEWIAESVKKLREQDFSLLQSPTYEGITLQPFYTATDAPQAASVYSQGWENQEHISLENKEESISYIENALENGADSLFFDLGRMKEDFLEELVRFLSAKKISIGFSVQNDVEVFCTFLKKHPLRGSIEYDYLAHWTMTGQLPAGGAENLAKLLQNTPSEMKALTIYGQVFQHAGANAVHELACSLALWVEYADQLTDQGISTEEVFANTTFSMAIGGNYFMEIAKFRAFRLLWTQICRAFSVSATPCPLHAQTSPRNKTTKDAYNNMLRATTEAMSAILGGCDSLTVEPYNANFAETDDFSRRIARNVSTILKEEAHIGKVKNAADGAYYIESLTQQLAEKSWTLFQQIEEKGGFVKAFEQGFIQEEIEKTAQQRLEDFKNQKMVLVGVNKYENTAEEPPKAFPTQEFRHPELKLLKPFLISSQ